MSSAEGQRWAGNTQERIPATLSLCSVVPPIGEVTVLLSLFAAGRDMTAASIMPADRRPQRHPSPRLGVAPGSQGQQLSETSLCGGGPGRGRRGGGTQCGVDSGPRVAAAINNAHLQSDSATHFPRPPPYWPDTHAPAPLSGPAPTSA